MRACLCASYLFYGGDSDNKEEGQAAGDWAGGSVDDKLQGSRIGRGRCRVKTREEHTMQHNAEYKRKEGKGINHRVNEQVAK